MSKLKRSRALRRNLRKQARKGTLSARERKTLLQQEKRFRKARRPFMRGLGFGAGLGTGALLVPGIGGLISGLRKDDPENEQPEGERPEDMREFGGEMKQAGEIELGSPQDRVLMGDIQVVGETPDEATRAVGEEVEGDGEEAPAAEEAPAEEAEAPAEETEAEVPSEVGGLLDELSPGRFEELRAAAALSLAPDRMQSRPAQEIDRGANVLGGTPKSQARTMVQQAANEAARLRMEDAAARGQEYNDLMGQIRENAAMNDPDFRRTLMSLGRRGSMPADPGAVEDLRNTMSGQMVGNNLGLSRMAQGGRVDKSNDLVARIKRKYGLR